MNIDPDETNAIEQKAAAILRDLERNRFHVSLAQSVLIEALATLTADAVKDDAELADAVKVCVLLLEDSARAHFARRKRQANWADESQTKRGRTVKPEEFLRELEQDDADGAMAVSLAMVREMIHLPMEGQAAAIAGVTIALACMTAITTTDRAEFERGLEMHKKHLAMHAQKFFAAAKAIRRRRH